MCVCVCVCVCVSVSIEGRGVRGEDGSLEGLCSYTLLY